MQCYQSLIFVGFPIIEWIVFLSLCVRTKVCDNWWLHHYCVIGGKLVAIYCLATGYPNDMQCVHYVAMPHSSGHQPPEWYAILKVIIWSCLTLYQLGVIDEYDTVSHTCTCTYTHVHTHMYTYVSTYAHIHADTQTLAHIHMQSVDTHIHIDMRTYTHTHTYIHTWIHNCAHTLSKYYYDHNYRYDACNV